MSGVDTPLRTMNSNASPMYEPLTINLALRLKVYDNFFSYTLRLILTEL